MQHDASSLAHGGQGVVGLLTPAPENFSSLPYLLIAVYMDYVKRVADTISAGAPVLMFGSGRQVGLVKKRLNEGYIQLLGQASVHVGGVRGPHTSGK
jgi:hypothetical protein